MIVSLQLALALKSCRKPRASHPQPTDAVPCWKRSGDHQDHQGGTAAATPYAPSAPVTAGLGAQACAGLVLDGLPDAALLWKQEGLLVKLWFSVSVVRTRHTPDLVCAEI
jgi:hypothetical protein